MLHIVLFEPEIPPNTGNVIRLAANTGCTLHIIEPTGFALDDKRLRRAGLDYGEWESMKVYPNWDNFLHCIDESLPTQRNNEGDEQEIIDMPATNPPFNLFAITTKGQDFYHNVNLYRENTDTYLLFGPETRGLPDNVLYHEKITQRVRIPMTANSRSMNLSNSVAVLVYEAWRQSGFTHAI